MWVDGRAAAAEAARESGGICGLVEPMVRGPWRSLSGLMVHPWLLRQMVMCLWYVVHVSLSAETAPGGEATRVCGWRK